MVGFDCDLGAMGDPRPRAFGITIAGNALLSMGPEADSRDLARQRLPGPRLRVQVSGSPVVYPPSGLWEVGKNNGA